MTTLIIVAGVIVVAVLVAVAMWAVCASGRAYASLTRDPDDILQEPRPPHEADDFNAWDWPR